jgi:hypothetical protein
MAYKDTRTKKTAVCVRLHMHVCVRVQHSSISCCLARTDLPMGVLSIVLAANSDTKLSAMTQVCSAYSWLNVGGKLLKLVALQRLFAEEKDIKRKMQKLAGRWSHPHSHAIIYREFTFAAVCCSQPLAPPPDPTLVRTRRDLEAHGTGGKLHVTVSSIGSGPCCMVGHVVVPSHALPIRTSSW